MMGAPGPAYASLGRRNDSSRWLPERHTMADADDVSEESRPLPALPRFGGGRAAVLAATEAPRGKMGKPGSDKPVITTMAPWAMRPGGTGAKASSRQRRAPSTWSPPEPGKAGTSPEKRSALAAPRPPPPPQAFLDSCPGLSGASSRLDLGTPDDASPPRPPADPRARAHPPPATDRDSKLRVELMTYAALFAGESPATRSPRVVIPVFQRTYCWSDEQVLGWWRDAAMRGGHSAMRVKGGHATGRCLFRRAREGRPEAGTDADAVADANETDDDDQDASPLLCLDGQQRCTTTLLAVAAIRDAALTLLAEDGENETETEPLTSTEKETAARVVERAERTLYADAAGARRWIRDRAAETSSAAADDGALYPEGARPPFATTLLPSFVDRAAFLRCVVGGALARARGTTPSSPPAAEKSSSSSRSFSSSRLSSTPMCRAKATLDAAASSLLTPRAAAAARLAGALDAMLEETRLTYVEIQGDDVDLAQAFQWLQEKTLFAAGAVLWNPAPGVHLAGSDLIRNALLAVTLRRSLREQESAYRDAWLDPLERRVERRDEVAGSNSKSLDDVFRAFLVDDARARGRRAPARWRGACERDLEAMMASDATPERLRETVGEGSPMWIYARFRSFVEEIALELAGEDEAARAARSARIGLGGEKGGGGGVARRDFDFTTSAPPPPPKATETEETRDEARGSTSDAKTTTTVAAATLLSTRAPWEGPAPTGIPVDGVDANADAAVKAAEAVPVTERACRDALDRVVAFAEKAGFLSGSDFETERDDA